MSEDCFETLKSSIFDEYSLYDAIAALVREHPLEWQEATDFIVREYNRGIFRLYKDGTESGKRIFIDVDIASIDFQKDDIKRIYLADKDPS